MPDSPYTLLQRIWNESNQDFFQSENINLTDFKNQLLNFFHVGDFYFYVFNVSKLTIDYIDDRMIGILGYEKTYFTPENIIANIHPDDIAHFVNFEQTTLEFLQKLPHDKLKKYKVSYDYRIKASSGEYIRILQQNIAIDISENGDILRTIGVHTNITHLKSDIRSSLSFIGLDGEPSFFNVDITTVIKSNDSIFSIREKEILTYISNGYSSKEISALIHVSKATIDTHRKNILRKSGCQSITQLIVRAVRQGWV